jgi:hypothetical protein
VRAADTALAVVFGVGRDLDERLRVWPNAAAGSVRTATSEAVAMRFNMILLFDFLQMLDCTKD